MYERGGKCIRSFFKEYKDALPEDESSIGFPTFHDIVNLLNLRGESRAGLSTNYIKFCHVENGFKWQLFHQNYWFFAYHRRNNGTIIMSF